MKKQRRLFSLLICTFLCLAFTLNVFASEKELDLPDMSIKFNIPSEAIVITPEIPVDDAVWEQAGIETPAEIILFMKDIRSSALVILGGEKFYISKNVSETTAQIHNLKLLKENEMSAFLEDFNYETEIGEESMKSSAKIVTINDMPFIQVSNYAVTELETVYEQVFFTVLNGFTVTFSQSSNKEITKEASENLLNMVNSIQFTQVTEKPLPDGITPEQIRMTFTIFFIMVGIFIVCLVIIIVRNKRAKKEERIFSAKLMNYRQDREEGFEKTQEILFSNSTEITDKSIDMYSVFQCFINKPLPYIATIAVTILCIVFLMFNQSSWWVILIFTIVLGFFSFKFATSAISMSKYMKKIYGKNKSRNALYNFYDREIQVCGIESNQFHPYFQITEIKQYKNYIYFYFGEYNPYFIDVNGFTKGELAEFKKYLMRKTRKKIK